MTASGIAVASSLPPSETHHRNWMTPAARRVGLFGATLFVIVALWQLVTASGLVKTYILPSPQAVFSTIARQAQLITHEAAATLSASLIGLIIGTAVGVGTAVVLAYLPFVDRAILPLAIVLSTAPLIAVIPVLVVALGNGPTPRIIIAALAATVTTVIYVRKGLGESHAEGEELLTTLDATRWQRIRIVQIYAMLPYLFAALRVSVSTCVIQTIVAEWITGTSGLGYLVQIAGASNRPELMWAAIVAAVVLTSTLLGMLALIESVATPWSTATKEGMR
ncbi:ABC transporter permease [Mycolicibacterium brisbanense]